LSYYSQNESSYLRKRWEILIPAGQRVKLIGSTHYLYIPEKFVKFLEKKFGDTKQLRFEPQISKVPPDGDILIIFTVRRCNSEGEITE